MSMATLQTHNLPSHVLWSITLSIAVLIGLTNFLMTIVSSHIVDWKFETTQNMISSGGAGRGALTLMSICIVFSGLSAALVVFGAPICGGSGIPEAKGYLNGNYVEGMF